MERQSVIEVNPARSIYNYSGVIMLFSSNKVKMANIVIEYRYFQKPLAGKLPIYADIFLTDYIRLDFKLLFRVYSSTIGHQFQSVRTTFT
jgi:hypothetical protein